MKMQKLTSSGYIFPAVIIVYAFTFLIGCDQGIDDYGPKVLEEARVWKSKIESDIQFAVDDVHKVASSLETMIRNNSQNREIANNLIKETLEIHPEYLAIWTCWEPNAFDNSDVKYRNALGHDDSGRYIPYWNRLYGEIQVAPLDKDFTNEVSICKSVIELGNVVISDPIAVRAGDYNDLKVSYVVPIKFEGNTVAAVGIDLPFLPFFKPIIRQVRVLDVAYGFLVSNNGIMVAHPTKWIHVGKPLEFFAFDPAIIKLVKNGQEASQIKISKTTGSKNYYQFVPIRVGNTENHWSLAISLIPRQLKRGSKDKW